ncbi:MAG: hypothetical protein MUC71_06505 [Steroidobacteraceae bacterium]|jgi:hypothetical protein|nr:hypothetical protein [Steroidobacteraceae bacterium]
MTEEAKLRWSDVWFLTALGRCAAAGPCALSEVIAAADAIDHSVMNFEEVSSAMVRLERHGLITVDAAPLRLGCTDKARALLASAQDAHADPLEACRALEKALGARPWMPGEPLPHPDNSPRHPALAEEDYRREVAAHLARVTPWRPPGP